MRVAIRLSPRAGAKRIDGIGRSADGAAVVKVSVTAPPAEHRANEALIALLAEEWQLPRRDVSIAGGAKSRNKRVHIAGQPRALLAKLAAALALLPGS
ncbi:MAG: DUF167 domain-containing protein [Alphaproteobacteria bacterium]|nr:DUF167 domain-containing protein [Alphaproteobacteria bacterium]MBV9150302.1 DUF167 domain-containing protein [Alphaproteobacteria bacterium]MBV9584266.1 DUF167 domain-containing protein [Alphaproteobacteria bacterium]MBV9967146.1 DUF167 domain-containing protein [Alphaproteobacteria bacterium]